VLAMLRRARLEDGRLSALTQQIEVLP